MLQKERRHKIDKNFSLNLFLFSKVFEENYYYEEDYYRNFPEFSAFVFNLAKLLPKIRFCSKLTVADEYSFVFRFLKFSLRKTVRIISKQSKSGILKFTYRLIPI